MTLALESGFGEASDFRTAEVSTVGIKGHVELRLGGQLGDCFPGRGVVMGDELVRSQELPGLDTRAHGSCFGLGCGVCGKQRKQNKS